MAIKISNSTIIDDSRNIVSAGVATVSALNISTTEVISTARQLKNIASLDATTTATIETAIANAPNTFTDINVTGIATFTNGPILVGTSLSTGTASQTLQVTGGAYVSGNIGIGTTNPLSPLQVVGVGSTGGIRIGTLDFFPFSSGNPGSGSPTFRNSFPNSQTILRVIPNGTGTAQFEFFGKDYYADINAWDNFRVFATGTSYRIDTSFGATGVIRPIILETGVSSGGISTNPNQLYLSTNGNIGIGTSIPVGQLQVSSGPVIIGSGTSTGTASQRLQVTGGAYVSGNLGIGTTNPVGQLQVSSGPVIIGAASSTGTTSQPLQVTGGGYFNGRIGIGTTNPQGSIHIYRQDTSSFGEVHTDFILENPGKGNARFFLKTRDNNRNWEFFADDDDGSFGIYDGVGNARRFSIIQDGNVLIGTSSTTGTGTTNQRLQVTGGGYFSSSVGIGSTNPSSTLSVGGTITELYNGTYWNLVSQADIGIGASQVPLNQYLGQLAFLDAYSPSGLRRDGGGADDVIVNSSGSVGIATTNPTSTLHVVGDALITGIATVNNNFVVNGNSLYVDATNNRVGIGTTNPTSTLHVVGNARVSGVVTATTYDVGVIGSQTSGILTTTATTANQVLDTLATGVFQTARYQVSIACTGQLVTAGMTTVFTSVGAITAGAGYTEATYTNVAITGGSGNDARANIGIGLSFNQVGFTSANNLIVTTAGHGLGIGVGTIAVSFASSIPNSAFTGFAVTAGNIYYAVGVGTTTLNLYQNANGTAQVTGIGTTTFAGVGNTMTKSGGVTSVTIVSPGSGYITGNTLSATLGTLGSGFSFPASTVVKNYQSTDIMILQSVGSAATACDFVEYSSLANHEILGSFGADISGTNARLLFTPTYRNNTIKVVRTGITV